MEFDIQLQRGPVSLHWILYALNSILKYFEIILPVPMSSRRFFTKIESPFRSF
jgi:hypothetical protein